MLTAAASCGEQWDAQPSQTAVAESHESKFRVGYPLAAHAMNHAGTALAVYRRHPLVAASSARIALENSLAAQWVLLTRDGERILVKHMEALYLTRARAFSAAMEDPSELADIAARSAAPGRERQWSAEQLFKRFADNNLFYDIYRQLSGAVHPSYETILAHLDLRMPASKQTISRNGDLNRDEIAATALAMASVFALDFFERCLKEPPRPSPVAAIAELAGLPYDLGLSDQMPELQPGVQTPT
ncbi:hypothetical protein GCM10029976_011820 [Kribbella albertanoniae]|uniref:Uncharacterized protein n=1 Tax=Kribbella albertanoniae TaxID=1266829 RepID=A0A4R4PW30_9ACTN|nr:hypothetical protein [Kribbella albertanoniae]TDC26539.1 hypothetical protein E1261_22200 [Kribbella albertanoniae]